MPRYTFDKIPGAYDLPSLADSKSLSLAKTLEEKNQRLTPRPIVPALPVDSLALARSLVGDGSGQDYNYASEVIDAGQASLYEAGGNLADAAKGVSNKLFDTNFDDRESTGYSNLSIAELEAGVDPQFSKDVAQGQQQVMTDVVNKNYGDALFSGLKVAIPSAVQSFGSLAEMGVGALATAVVPPLGGAIFGKKAVQAAGLAEKAKAAFDKAKKAKETAEKLKKADKLGKALHKAKQLPGMAAKATSQVSLLTVDLTQRQVAAYREKYGKDPSLPRVAGMALGILATEIWSPAIVSNLFIGSVKKEIIKEGQNLVKNLGKGSNLISIGKRIGTGLFELSKAGAAESVQEYLQTWQEIFSLEITPEQSKNLWEAVASKISDPKLRAQALTGGIIGGFAGGAVKAGISAPGFTAGTALDLTKATAKGAVKTTVGAAKIAGSIGQDLTVAAGIKALSPEETSAAIDRYNTDKAVVDKKTEVINKKVETVDKAETIEDLLSNEEFKPAVEKMQKDFDITDKQLKNPKNLNRIKDKLARTFKAQAEALDLELKTSTVAKTAAVLGKRAKDKTVETAEKVIEKIPVEKKKAAVKLVKESGKTAIKAVKEIRSSTALGLVELATKNTEEFSKETLAEAKKIELSDIKKTIKAIEKSNPLAAKQLERVIRLKQNFQEKVGTRTNNLIDSETLSPVVSSIVKTGTISPENITAAADAIQETVAGKISDLETLNTVKEAVAIYKESDKNNKTGPIPISENGMAVIENRLANAATRLEKEPTADQINEGITDTVDFIDENTKELRNKAVSLYKQGRAKITEIVQNQRLKAAKAVGPEEVTKVKAEIAKEIEEVAALKVEADQLIKETKTTVPKETVRQKRTRAVEGAANIVSSLIKFATKTAKATPQAVANFSKNINREVKTLPAGDLNTMMTNVSNALAADNNSEVSRELSAGINNIVTAVKAAGYESVQDLDDFVKQFHGLAKDKDFHNQLKAEFTADIINKSEVLMNEDTDNLATEEVSEETAKELYDELPDNIKCTK